MSIRNEQNGNVYYTLNDSPKLPVIIMVHGYRGTHHGLELIAKRLGGYRVIIPDLPGFGETKPLNVEHSLENYVSWLDKFIDSLQLSKPPVLLGHSFGSIVASSYASKHPKKITKLILINPIGAPALKGPRAIMTRFALFFYWIGRMLPEPRAKRWLSAKPIVQIMSTTMTKTDDKKLRQFILNQHLTYFNRFANSKVAEEAFKTSTTHNVRDVAQIIDVPTLLIAGDRDDITPIAKQRELAKLFPDASLKIIKGVGHLTHYETPDQLANEIKKFTR